MIIKECNFEFVNLSIKEHLMFINLVFVRVMIIYKIAEIVRVI